MKINGYQNLIIDGKSRREQEMKEKEEINPKENPNTENILQK